MTETLANTGQDLEPEYNPELPAPEQHRAMIEANVGSLQKTLEDIKQVPGLSQEQIRQIGHIVVDGFNGTIESMPDIYGEPKNPAVSAFR
jgi:hypothetical protein